MKTEEEIRKELDETMKSLKTGKKLEQCNLNDFGLERKKIGYAKALIWVLGK